MIQNLPELEPRFREIGQVKIGALDYANPKQSKGGGTYYPPLKYDHFKIIMGRDDKGLPIPDMTVHKALGDDKPRRLRIYFAFDTLEGNYFDWLAAYNKTQKLCFGNGIKAQRLNLQTQHYVEMDCTCEWYTAGTCKPHAILTFMLEAAGRIGGVYAYRTTSKNGIRALRGSLMQIMGLGIPLSMVPFDLVLTKKKVRTKDNKMEDAWVVHVEFVGNTDRLFDVARERVQLMQTFGPSMLKAREIVQQQARRAMESQLLQIKCVAEEFQPENMTRGEVTAQAAKSMTVEAMAPEAQAAQPVPASSPEPPAAASAPAAAAAPIATVEPPKPTGPTIEEAIAKANSLFPD